MYVQHCTVTWSDACIKTLSWHKVVYVKLYGDMSDACIKTLSWHKVVYVRLYSDMKWCICDMMRCVCVCTQLCGEPDPVRRHTRGGCWEHSHQTARSGGESPQQRTAHWTVSHHQGNRGQFLLNTIMMGWHSFSAAFFRSSTDWQVWLDCTGEPLRKSP